MIRAQTNQWRVAVVLSSGAYAVTDPDRYADRAAAERAALRAHAAKPFLNFVAVEA